MSGKRARLEVTGNAALGAAARSGLYALLARAMAVPDEDLYQAMVSGEIDRALAEVSAELPFALEPPLLSGDHLPFVEFQAEFIAFFEVGVESPPCPLYEGAFTKGRGRKAVMEDLLRFYKFFKVEMSRQVRELPDYLPAELEFMHYLSFLEVGIIDREGEDAPARADLQRAQRDFLSRHLAPWSRGLADRSADRQGPEPYRELLSFFQRFACADLARLEENILPET